MLLSCKNESSSAGAKGKLSRDLHTNPGSSHEPRPPAATSAGHTPGSPTPDPEEDGSGRREAAPPERGRRRVLRGGCAEGRAQLGAGAGARPGAGDTAWPALPHAGGRWPPRPAAAGAQEALPGRWHLPLLHGGGSRGRVPGTQPGHPDGRCPPPDGLCQHHDQPLCTLGVLAPPHQNHELRMAPGRDPGGPALRALHLGGHRGSGLPGGPAPALGGLRHRGRGHAHHLRLCRGRQHRDGGGSAPDGARAQPWGGQRAAQRQRPRRLRPRRGGPAAERRCPHRLLRHLLQARVQIRGSHLHLPLLRTGAGDDADHPPRRPPRPHGGDPQRDGFQRGAGDAAGGAGRGGRAQPAHLGADGGAASALGAHRHQRGCQRTGGAGGGQLAAAGCLPLPHHHHPGGELLRGDAGLPGVPAPPRLTAAPASCGVFLCGK